MTFRSTIVCVLCIFSALAHAAIAADGAVFPSELRLTSGATLRKCSVVRWTSESVVVKHAGGTDPIRFSNIAADQRAIVAAVRKAALEAQSVQAARLAAPTNQKKERVFKGQVFVALAGGTNSKLGSVNVRAFPLSVLDRFAGMSDRVLLPKPLASTVTDADGRFSLAVPGEESFFIFAQSSRYVGPRTGTEFYDWRVSSDDIKDPENVLLSNRNLAQRNFNVIVEE